MRENKEDLDNGIKGNTDIIQQQQNPVKETTKENPSYREIMEILEENKSNRKSKYVDKYECWFIKSIKFMGIYIIYDVLYIIYVLYNNIWYI